MSVEVKFEMYVDDENCLSEEVVITNIDTYRPGIVQGRRLEGTILICSPNIPDKCIQIQDALGALAKRLCFEGVSKLVANQTVDILFFTYYAKLKLEPENEFIAISGDHVPNVKLLRLLLLPALYHCGLRYLSLLRLLGKYESYYQHELEDLEKIAKTTERVLKDAEMI